MKKVILAVVAIIVIAGGAYALFYKSPKPTPRTASSSSSQSSVTATNNTILVTKTNASVGQYLADSSGKTLYTYNADSKGASNCTGSCLHIWPAYVDKGATTNLQSGVGTIKRTDNSEIQYTYNGMPLYFFEGDTSPGQVTGNGEQNFTVAKPAASTATTSSQTSNTSSGSSNSW